MSDDQDAYSKIDGMQIPIKVVELGVVEHDGEEPVGEVRIHTTIEGARQSPVTV